MERKEKISLLKALQRGEINIKALQHGKPYFVRHFVKHNIFEVSTLTKGEKPCNMTPAEYEMFLKELEEHNKMMQHQILKNVLFVLEDAEGDPK